jgi:fatty acid desaturase
VNGENSEMKANKSAAFLLAVLLLTALACEPVIAIGWGELLILLVLIAVLLGPLLLRIYRTLKAFHGQQKKSEGKKKAP